MSDEPEWSKILDFMYDYGISVSTAEELNQRTLSEAIAERTEMEKETVFQNLTVMEDWGLLQKGRREGQFGPYWFYGLTEDRFKLEHERRALDRREKTNQALVIFTFTLVLVGLMDLVPWASIRIGAAIIILTFLAWVVLRTDILV